MHIENRENSSASSHQVNNFVLMTGPKENIEFYFPSSLNISLGFAWDCHGGRKSQYFPSGQSLNGIWHLSVHEGKFDFLANVDIWKKILLHRPCEVCENTCSNIYTNTEELIGHPP